MTATGRTALALCGGGITGGVYELGALLALDDFFVDGFDVTRFDVYVGTSAGAVLATLTAAGMRPQQIVRALLDPRTRAVPIRRSDVFQLDVRQAFGVARDILLILGGSLRRAAMGRPVSLGELAKDLEDALPAGIFSLDHFERWLTELFAAHGIATSFAGVPRELLISANDLDSGHRIIFGEEGSRDVPIPRAICASCAIPLFFEPVTIDGRDYVDGAVGKSGHLDVALRRGVELLVVVNPRVPIRNEPGAELPSALIGVQRIRDKGLLAVYEQAQRMSVRTKLHAGIRRYRLEYPNATILLVEPSEREADMMLANPMSFGATQRLLRYGYDSAARLITERRGEFEAALCHHRIRCDVGRLTGRPWELVG